VSCAYLSAVSGARGVIAHHSVRCGASSTIENILVSPYSLGRAALGHAQAPRAFSIDKASVGHDFPCRQATITLSGLQALLRAGRGPHHGLSCGSRQLVDGGRQPGSRRGRIIRIGVCASPRAASGAREHITQHVILHSHVATADLPHAV